MTPRRIAWSWRRRRGYLALPLLALLLVGFAKKLPVTVRFYAEANSQDTDYFAIPVQLQYPPRKAYVQKIPVISERDVEAIYPFQANDGSMGCAFKLDLNGAAELDSVSVQEHGRSLVVVVNGRQVTDLIIDRRVSDGIISIPGGLTQEEIASLTKKFPVLGAAKKHPRKMKVEQFGGEPQD